MIHHFYGNGAAHKKGVAERPKRCDIQKRGDPKRRGSCSGSLTLVSYPNVLTRELTILLRIETDYRWTHIFNELSAHECQRHGKA